MSTLRQATQLPAVRRAARAAKSQSQRLARRGGFELIQRSFYDPLPDVVRLAERTDWHRPLPTPGLDLRVGAAAELLDRSLRPYLAEFRPPVDGLVDGRGFFIHNRSYESVDAETLYAILRHAKPARVVELGSGASSHVIAAARARNARDGLDFEHVIFDPFPFLNPMGAVEGPEVHRLPAEEIKIEQIALAAGDILFVDTTHTVKTGGDVTQIVLDIVPRLPSGALVHFHDVFLPFDYPREWVVDQRRAWSEQYLVQAFLAFNREFKVVLPTYAVLQERTDLIVDLIASYDPTVRPGSFWIERA